MRRANVRRVLRLFAPHRSRLALLCALIILSAVVLVVPAFLIKRALEAVDSHDTAALAYAASGMIVAALVYGPLSVAQTFVANQIGQRVMHDLRAAVFRHLQRLSLAFFTRTRSGEVQSRITNDIGGVQNVVTETATTVVAGSATFVAALAGMFVLSWKLALFGLALVPLFVAVIVRVGWERRKVWKATQETLADLSSHVNESLSVSGILLGKTMGRNDALAERFEQDSLKLADLGVRQRMAGRWVMAAIQTGMAVAPAAIYWFGGSVLGGHVSVPLLVAVTALQQRLFGSSSVLLEVGLDVQASFALFDRIFEYLEQPVDIVERRNAHEHVAGAEVVFEGVSFRYSEPGWTLEDVTFRVDAGTTTAIVGETGSGKTTLAYLAARLYEPQEGSVRIGGVDVRDLSFDALARLVGVVAQETYLFHATVRENLAFANPDASDEEIVAAAEAARIHHVVAALPDGYETVVGERGYRFSGGEKQRIAIARTLLRNPPILVLDEATSSLDAATERLVQEALDRLAEGRTTIAIAHRLSTVRDAHQIIVLEQGRIVERGRHEELMALGARYAALVSRDAELELLVD